MCSVVLHKTVTKIYAESIASVYSTPGGEGGTTGLRVRGWGSNLDDWRGSLFTLPVSSHINSSSSGAGTKLRKSIKIVKEKSAKLVIDHVANISVHYVSVGASTAKALYNWGSVTRKRNTVFGQIL
jgi:hypothetical protein